jgi:hypothetical protein
MIVKGKPRSAPAQLADYLLRSDEEVTLLELQYGDSDLKKAFLDWDAAGAATKGEKTLYHAQIAWETKYKLDEKECLRLAQILAEDLGMADHPRAVVLHGGHGRPHLHVVFMRTDTKTMTMWDDGRNYLKHEKASLRMEQEFGMDIIPGKHAKRDRKKQAEFPRAEMTSDEAMHAKRNGTDLKQLKAQLAAMKAASDSPEAFRNAVESAGLVLAKGERGYTLVDEQGTPYNLARQLKVKIAEVNAYMAAIPLASLPTVEEAQELQKQHALAKLDALREQRKKEKAAREQAPAPEQKGVEASKFLPPPDGPKPPELPQPEVDPELERRLNALSKRQAEDMQKWAELHAYEVGQKEFELDKLFAEKTSDFDAIQQQERDALKASHAEKRKGIKGIIEAIENRWNPTLGAEKAKERRREIAQLKRRQEQERKDYLALLEQNRQLEIENLRERQALKQQDEQHKHNEERERYIREHEDAKRLREQIVADQLQEELERNESLRDGPPPPKLGK